MEDELLKVQDLAEILGKTEGAIYQMRYRGEGPPAVRLGRGPKSHLRFRRSDVDKWLASQVEPVAG